jgi:hypothetical protein
MGDDAPRVAAREGRGPPRLREAAARSCGVGAATAIANATNSHCTILRRLTTGKVHP